MFSGSLLSTHLPTSKGWTDGWLTSLWSKVATVVRIASLSVYRFVQLRQNSTHTKKQKKLDVEWLS